MTWLNGAGGLNFESAGLVLSNEPLRPPETQATESYTLELLLRPATTKSACTILAFYTARSRLLLVRRYKDGLLVTHDARVESDPDNSIKFDVDHVFRPGKLVLVTISSGPKGTAVDLDGQPAGSFPRFTISRSELSGEIVLGTSPMSYAPWSGEVRGLALYAKELTPADAVLHYKEWTGPSGRPDLDGALARYTFAQRGGSEVRNEVTAGPQLEIPVVFSVPHKPLLQPVAKEFRTTWRYAINLLMNVAGFVPLGLIVCAYLAWTRSRWQAILTTTIACGFLSFIIEVLQYYIPRRGSGVTDIVTNTLGAVLGATLTQMGEVRHVLEEMKLIRVQGQVAGAK